MTDVLQTLRPKEHTTTAIRAALHALQAERSTVLQRIADAEAAWPALLLNGSAASIKAAEAARKDDELTLERLNALEGELKRKLTEAAAAEAGAARAQQVCDAAAKIQKFNDWLATRYEPAARQIAEGVQLENDAVQAINGLRENGTGAVLANLPPLARAFVGRDSRSLAFLTRLPAAHAGPAIVWP